MTQQMIIMINDRLEDMENASNITALEMKLVNDMVKMLNMATGEEYKIGTVDGRMQVVK